MENLGNVDVFLVKGKWKEGDCSADRDLANQGAVGPEMGIMEGHQVLRPQHRADGRGGSGSPGGCPHSFDTGPGS